MVAAVLVVAAVVPAAAGLDHEELFCDHYYWQIVVAVAVALSPADAGAVVASCFSDCIVGAGRAAPS